jgi:hypothetical protein
MKYTHAPSYSAIMYSWISIPMSSTTSNPTIDGSKIFEKISICTEFSYHYSLRMTV